MTPQDTPPLTDKELDILEELWNSDPSWAKDSLLVLRDLRELREAAWPFAFFVEWAFSGGKTLPDDESKITIRIKAGHLRRLAASLPERRE